ncbi:MAG: hypothetical protein ACOVNY_02240 [Chitinophagaceae bacterium]
MKKLFCLSLFIAIGLITSNISAQPNWSRGNKHGLHKHHYHHEPERIAYYYYPSANVYYNPINRNYFYPRNGVWVSVNVLPRNIFLRDDRYTVYAMDDEPVWRYNRDHCNRFGHSSPAPVVVVTPSPAPRRPGVSVVIGANF